MRHVAVFHADNQAALAAVRCFRAGLDALRADAVRDVVDAGADAEALAADFHAMVVAFVDAFGAVGSGVRVRFGHALSNETLHDTFTRLRLSADFPASAEFVAWRAPHGRANDTPLAAFDDNLENVLFADTEGN